MKYYVVGKAKNRDECVWERAQSLLDAERHANLMESLQVKAI